MINVILLEDVKVTALGIKSILAETDEIELVDHYSDVSKFIHDILDENGHMDADLVIVDMRMNGDDNAGIKALEAIERSKSNLAILIYTAYNHPKYIETFCNLDIPHKGMMLKDMDISEGKLTDAIRTIIKDGYYASQSISKNLALVLRDKSEQIEIENQLTEREIEVLKLTELGFRDEEIAKKLFLSKSTIKGYKHKVRQKLDPDTSLSEKLTLAGIIRYLRIFR